MQILFYIINLKLMQLCYTQYILYFALNIFLLL